MQNPEKILFFDAKALCYAAFYGVGGLGTAEGPTGVIYGFFSQVSTICKRLQCSHVVFAWDSKNSHRRRIFSGYKNRNAPKEENIALQEALPQFEQIRKEILPRLNFVNSFMANGYEADDIIASLCLFPPPEENQQYIIVSNDNDLNQLLTDRVCQYKFTKRVMYTKRDFIQEHGIDPSFWPFVKAAAGCTTDTVPGIFRVGEKTVCKYIQEGRWNPKIDNSEAKAIIERNKPLVTLPFKNTPKFTLDWSNFPDYAEWLALCEELEFYSFLRERRTWEHIFTNTKPTNGMELVKIKQKGRDK